MNVTPSARVKPVTAWMRGLFLFAGILAFIAGLQLFILTEQTDRYFAWTIHPSLMAAFLGGAFWAGAVGVVLAARQPFWAPARPFLFGATTFTVLMLLTTLLHLERFHLDRTDGALGFAVIWLAVYLGLPPVVVGLWLWQWRTPGSNPPRLAPLSSLARGLLFVSAAITLVLGAGLALAPQLAAVWWPWDLTPLTAQATASVLWTLTVSATLVAWENDQRSFKSGLGVLVVGAALELIALVRYLDEVHWNRPLAWLYLPVLLGLLISSVGSLLTPPRHEPAPVRRDG
jgi:hypothetical protein